MAEPRHRRLRRLISLSPCNVPAHGCDEAFLFLSCKNIDFHHYRCASPGLSQPRACLIPPTPRAGPGSVPQGCDERFGATAQLCPRHPCHIVPGTHGVHTKAGTELQWSKLEHFWVSKPPQVRARGLRGQGHPLARPQHPHPSPKGSQPMREVSHFFCFVSKFALINPPGRRSPPVKHHWENPGSHGSTPAPRCSQRLPPLPSATPG